MVYIGILITDLTPTSVLLASDPVSPIWPVPSDVILMCIVKFGPAVDIPGDCAHCVDWTN